MLNQELRDHVIAKYIKMLLLHHMQAEQVTQQLQQMELVASPTTTGDDNMATQAEMLDHGM